MGRPTSVLVAVCLAFHWVASTKPAQAQVKIDSATFGAIEARSIGPAKTSGRISAIDAVASDARIVYVGSASGGVWKSTNGGTTFKSVFDKNPQSIGAIAVDPTKSDTIWVGTGESWVRNSVSVGAGVYKSTDGGDNWQLVGLEDSERISKIVVNPKQPDTVFVAAVGHLWNSNEQRGLYRTTDGGKTWERVLYVDADTGCSDVAIDPQDPRIVYAGMWQFRRQPWSFHSGGKGSGLYVSRDGGKTFERVSNGMPEGDLGRIALAVAPTRPNVVYATIESKKTALYRSDDTGRTWNSVGAGGEVASRPFYFSVLIPDPKDFDRIYKPGFQLTVSKDGGKSFSQTGGSYHGDCHALWVDPQNTATMYLGTDGGVYKSLDFGRTWSHLRNLPVAQFYRVSFDMQQPYNVYGGLQDNGAWVGPSQSVNGVENADWENVGFGDGFYTFADPSDPAYVFTEYQGGKLSRFNRRTLERKSIAPLPDSGAERLRFNWNTPVEMSPTNPGVLYIGAQVLFRSSDKGDSWQRISPDLTTNDPKKLNQGESGGLTVDNSSAENHCTIYSISESPVDQSVIWVGTDDGNVQITTDGGKTWKNVVANVPGLPANTWCSTIESSHFDRGTAYATFDGHATGDMKTYVFKTKDFGQTWTSLVTPDLKSYAHVIREDLVNPNLLFVGTESGMWISLDGGGQWAQFTGKLPNVAVRDIAIHPRDADVIIATHGRGMFILDDITPLRKLTTEVLGQELAVLESRPSVVKFGASIQDFPGDDEFVGENPPEAAVITYYLKDRHVIGDFKIQVLDEKGSVITNLPAGKRRGINRVIWPMRLRPPKVPRGAGVEGGSILGPVVAEGTYTVKFLKGDKEVTSTIVLVGDPTLAHSSEDRKLQQTTVMKLYGMLERLAYVSESISELRDQAKARAESLGANDPLSKDLKAYADELDTFYSTLAATKEGRITGEEQLREKVGGLYGDVSGFAGKPSQSQMARLTVLETEVDKAGKAAESFASARLQKINSALSAKKKDPLVPLSREEWEKRQSK